MNGETGTELTFPSVENLYHYRKLQMARAPKETLDTLLVCTPSEAKKIGKSVDLGDFLGQWDYEKRFIMKDAVKCKFAQNKELADQLISTNEQYLEESNSWGDKYWGMAYIPSQDGMLSVLGDKYVKLGGKNMLGHILMQVRNELIIERG